MRRGPARPAPPGLADPGLADPGLAVRGDPAPTRPARRRRPWLLLVPVGALVAVLAVVMVVVPWGGPGAPLLTVRSTLTSSVTAPGRPGPLPWPTSGQAAVAIPEAGVAVQSAAEKPAPVASLTKIMTAYLVLRDHPLGAGASGPALVMGAADVADFEQDTVTDQESARVTVGEVLTERQVMTGMLVHSADNLADTLARWDAGSIPAFVHRMNAAARGLGMRRTHFADTSGYDPGSVSTPADLLKVTAAAMRIPAFRQIVRMPSVTLPVAGNLVSYTPLLGLPGVVGVKSGFTSAAGGGDLIAWHQPVDGRPVTVLAAVTGLQGPEVLFRAGLVALSIARAAGAQLEPVAALGRGQRVAVISRAGRPAPATALAITRPMGVVAWPGQRVQVRLLLRSLPRSGIPRGACLGRVTVTLGAERSAEPACTTGPLEGLGGARGLL